LQLFVVLYGVDPGQSHSGGEFVYKFGFRFSHILLCSAVALATFFSAAPAHASVVYLVTVDTSAINGVSGNIDFQFNPGGPSSQSASALISLFSSAGGILGGAPDVIGDVTGTLPGDVAIGNTPIFNDYFQPFTFGTSFQFQLTLDGPAITSPNGSATSTSFFGLSLFDAAGGVNLLTTDPLGFVATAQINLDGSVTPTAFPSDQPGGVPVVTFSNPPAGVPEPSTFAFLSSSLLAMAGFAAVRRKSTN
jgi:hypothetical protein